ncbi:MAG: transposase [Clostridiales bacterium]|nr:transposase [Clostridiales bacterium]
MLSESNDKIKAIAMDMWGTFAQVVNEGCQARTRSIVMEINIIALT